MCYGHLRFFTRAGIERLFREPGLTIECLQGLTEAVPAAGDAFIEQAVTLLPDADQESLRTVEFLAVARKPRSTSA